MAEDHNDIFHCLKCGRIAYEPHGTSPPPACCGQPMVRAVADVAKPGPGGGEGKPPRESEVDEYALLAEAMELSHWSRSFPDADVARYDELALRVESLSAGGSRSVSERGSRRRTGQGDRRRARVSRSGPAAAFRGAGAVGVVRPLRRRLAQRTESLSWLGRSVRSARCLVDGFPTPRRDRERPPAARDSRRLRPPDLKAGARRAASGGVSGPSARTAYFATGSG